MAAKSYGRVITMAWLAGSRAKALWLCSRRWMALIENPNSTTPAAMSGATHSERFSHSSRRSDQ